MSQDHFVLIQVKRWITLNEPWVTAVQGHAFGDHAPGIKAPGILDYVAAHNQIRCQFHQNFTSNFLYESFLLCVVFLYLQFVLVIFWHYEISKNAACKMFVKLTTGLTPKRTGFISENSRNLKMVNLSFFIKFYLFTLG